MLFGERSMRVHILYTCNYIFTPPRAAATYSLSKIENHTQALKVFPNIHTGGDMKNTISAAPHDPLSIFDLKK